MPAFPSMGCIRTLIHTSIQAMVLDVVNEFENENCHGSLPQKNHQQWPPSDE
jgi:hypothetical protein